MNDAMQFRRPEPTERRHVPRGGHDPDVDQSFDLNLSAEAKTFLNTEANLDPAKREIVDTFLMARLFQEAWWNTDVGDSDAEARKTAATIEVTLDMARAAVTDVLDPIQLNKHLFLNAIAASNGDITMCMAAYEAKDRFEAENTPMVFKEADAKPYIRQLDIAFGDIIESAKSGDTEAQQLLRQLLTDLGDVPSVQIKGWLKRAIVNSAPDDLTGIKWKEVLKSTDGKARFEALLKQYLGGDEDLNELGEKFSALVKR